QQALGDEKSVENGGACADERDNHAVFGQKVGQVLNPPVVLAARESIDEGGDNAPSPLWEPDYPRAGTRLRRLPGPGGARVGAPRLRHRVAVDVLDRDAAVERLARPLGPV